MSKILFLTTDLYNETYKGGIQLFNQFFYQALVQCHHTVKVLAINEPISVNQTAPNVHGVHQSHRKIDFSWKSLLWGCRFSPDIIICGHANFALLSFCISSFIRVPLVIIGHGIEIWTPTTVQKWIFPRCHQILAVSRYTRDRLLQSVPELSPRHLAILPNTFDANRFFPQPKPASLMKRLGIRRGDKVILTISRMDSSEQYKGYDKVISALLQMETDRKNLKYLLVGKGEDRKRIEEMITELGLQDNVIMTGFVDDDELVDYYNLCDVFAMPSKGEGFGIVFLEALACGKPVLAGNSDGSVDALKQGEFGVLVPPDDIGQIAQALDTILNEEKGRDVKSQQRLHKKVVEAYGFKRFCRTVEKYFPPPSSDHRR